MPLVRDESGRLHIESSLMGESLMRRGLQAETDLPEDQIYRPLPDLNIVKIGGQSIIDRGREVLLPILDGIIAAQASHQIVIVTGGGSRSRHAYAIALDLGMPAGVLAKLAPASANKTRSRWPCCLPPMAASKSATMIFQNWQPTSH